ncbi:hypothetical protein ACQKNX_08080 [Lysinibacillus sp. NPDC093712]
MIKKLTIVIDNYFWIDDEATPEEKRSYYKFGITFNTLSIAMFILVKGFL